MAAVEEQVAAAANETDPCRRRWRLTVVIGGGGATGVELAGELAEELPELARRHGAPPEVCRVVLIDAGPTILAGSSPELVSRANQLLADLGVRVCTNARVARATEDGFVLKSGEVVEGGVLVWAGGVKAPEVLVGSGLPIGHNGRVKVDQYLRALDLPEIYVAGDVASVVDPDTGRALPPTICWPSSTSAPCGRSLIAPKVWSCRWAAGRASRMWPAERSAAGSPTC